MFYMRYFIINNAYTETPLQNHLQFKSKFTIKIIYLKISY